MDKNYRVFSWMLVSVAVILLWLSAHDFYVSRINQQQQSLIQALQQGNHDLNWPFKEAADLVTGFGSGWDLQPKGLQLNTEQAEISLAFHERYIVPELYQQLTFDWVTQQSKVSTTHLSLEFSQVDSGIYYYSPSIKIKPGLNQINLNRLKWTAKIDQQSQQLNWQDLPPLNTLVWRFSQQESESNRAFLSHVGLPQTTVLETIYQAAPLSAVLTNQLRQQWQSQRYSLNSPPVMHVYLAMPPLILFVVGGLLLMVAVMVYQPVVRVHQRLVNKKGITLVIALVAVIAALMQTKLLFIALERWPWIAIVVFMLPTLLLIKRWIRPHSAAGSIWLVTLAFASVMFYLSDADWSFIRDLPLYVLWALTQQVILGPLVSDYLHQKAGMSQLAVALLCGILFALLHVPNQMLMLATFFGGMLWSYAWLRYQNIYANAVSHALLALLFYQAMPQHLLGTARVGLWF